MKKSIEINTFYKLIGGLNQLGIEAGTNAPKGGDSGAGGRTFLKLSEEGGTAWDVTVIDACGNAQVIESPSSISITLGGDSELSTLIRALEFALDALKGTSEGVIQKTRETVL